MSTTCYYLMYNCAFQYGLLLGAIVTLSIAATSVFVLRNENDYLSVILAFTISLCIPSYFQTRQWGFVYPFNDSSLDLTLTRLIQESGIWYPNMGFDVIRGYSLYPVLHMWTASLSIVTGMDAAVWARIFPFIFQPLVIIFFYLGLKQVFSKEVAFLACIMFNLNGSLHFWEYYVSEFMALIFFSMCIYFVFRRYKRRDNRASFTFLIIFSVFMTVISHHWTSYNLVILFGILAFFPIFYDYLHQLVVQRTRAPRKTRIGEGRIVENMLLMTTLIITALWTFYLAYNLTVIQVVQFVSFFANVLSPSASFVGHSMTGLDFESRISLYFGYSVLGFLGIVELARRFFAKKHKNYDDCIFESWFIFAGIYIFVGTFMLPSGGEWWVISWRSWVFAFFGLMPLSAITISRICNWKPRIGALRVLSKLRVLAPLLLIFPLVSSVLMAPPEIRVAGYPRVPDSFYWTAVWVKQNLHEEIATDSWAGSVIVPYGRESLPESLKWPGGMTVFINHVYGLENSSEIRSLSWKTVIFNKNINNWVSTVSNSSSSLDQYYNRIYDSDSLITFKLPNPQ